MNHQNQNTSRRHDDDFKITDFKILDSKKAYLEAKFRITLARFFILFFVIANPVAATYGILTNDFLPLQVTSGIGIPSIWLIIKYYFRRKDPPNY